MSDISVEMLVVILMQMQPIYALLNINQATHLPAQSSSLAVAADYDSHD